MKKFTLSLVFIAFGFVANAQMSSDVTLSSNQVSNQSVSEMRIGTITELTENGGKIIEDGGNITRDFYHPGAQVEFKVGDTVTYLVVNLPNGRVIVKNISHR